MRLSAGLVIGLLLSALPAGIASADTIWLDDLSLSAATQGWGIPHKNQSVEGRVLTIGGKVFERGFGTHANSSLRINLNGGAQKFSASVGVDDEVNTNAASSVEFIVRGDDKVLWKSGTLRARDAARDFTVDLTGLKTLWLEVTDGGDGNSYDHADWANAKFETVPGQLLTTVAEPTSDSIPAKIADLTKLGSVMGVKTLPDGILLETSAGWMKITVCSASVLRLQTAMGVDSPSMQVELPGGRTQAKTDFSVSEDKKTIALQTAELHLSISRKSGAISLLDQDGKFLLKEHGAGIECGGSGKGYALEFGLGANEHIFGHGDVAGPLDHRTMKNIRMQVEYRPRNVCVPFFMSTAGYGMFLNDTSQKLRFDYFGEKSDGFYTISCDDGILDCFLIVGQSLKKVMGNYTATVVGRAPLIPRYGFGVIWSMNSGCNYAEAMQTAKRFRDEDLPLDSVQFEPGPGYAAYVPKAAGKSERETIESLAALNYHVAAWTGRYPHFWQDHRQWMDWGLDWIKIDPAGRDYNSNSSQDVDALTVMKEFTDFSGGRRAFITDCAGSTRAALHPSIRMCDRAGRTSTWKSMLNTAMTGVPYFFCDYWCTQDGGLFEGSPDDPRQNVWSRETIPQNLFLPTVNGQSWSYKYLVGFPWEQSDEWENDYRYYAKLRYRLLPYYYSCAADCTLFTGIPMTRPLALEFENDPKTFAIDADEFMFGDSLLVAIAYAEMKGSREVYLPAGARWLDYWSGQAFEGGQKVKLTIPEKGPDHLCGLYVRAGAIIPMGPEATWIGSKADKPAAQNAPDEMLLDVYPYGTSAFRMIEDDGVTTNYLKGDYSVTPMKCQSMAGSTLFTIGCRSGNYQPAARSYLMKFNGRLKPNIVALNGETLTACKSYAELADAKSGWFLGPANSLIHGPPGFTLSPHPDTIWVKIPDTGKRLEIDLKTTK
jgi:alpha-glucosidase (family GH31 glycosyl hydrolase)